MDYTVYILDYNTKCPKDNIPILNNGVCILDYGTYLSVLTLYQRHPTAIL